MLVFLQISKEILQTSFWHWRSNETGSKSKFCHCHFSFFTFEIDGMDSTADTGSHSSCCLNCLCFVFHCCPMKYLYKTCPKICGSDPYVYWTSRSRFSQPLIITSTLLGRLSTRFWPKTVGICKIGHKNINGVKHWCWVRKTATQTEWC